MNQLLKNMRSDRERGSIAAFYDEFSLRLLRDFVYGNLRVDLASALVRSNITPRTRKILDVGCGIGTTSAKYIVGHPHVSVHGVDISPRNIEIANLLSKDPLLKFSVSDMSCAPGGGPYDIVALIDVYEHIPPMARPQFHATISNSLTRDGKVVLTFPTFLHQQWLAENEPQGLQIVDETIGAEDLLAFGAAIDAKLTYFEWVSVWKTNQYCHAILSRSPVYESTPTENSASIPMVKRIFRHLKRVIAGSAARESDLDEIEDRRESVRRTLGITID